MLNHANFNLGIPVESHQRAVGITSLATVFPPAVRSAAVTRITTAASQRPSIRWAMPMASRNRFRRSGPLTVSALWAVPPLPLKGERSSQSRRSRRFSHGLGSTKGRRAPSQSLAPLLAPMKWGRGGSGEARDGEGASSPLAIPGTGRAGEGALPRPLRRKIPQIRSNRLFRKRSGQHGQYGLADRRGL
jgi:hypothetical protein